MKTYLLPLISFFMGMVPQMNGQKFDSLDHIKSDAGQIYFSAGNKKRARSITVQFEKAMVYYRDLLDYKPTVSLLILSNVDWGKYSTMGLVYGMPHYDPGSKTLFVAAEDNPFWKSFLPPLDGLPKGLRDQIQTIYKNPNGDLSMQPFFDLLAIHELGHAFHYQYNLNMQRKWMGELFVNILLHTYIAENEPHRLPALTVFPKMVVTAGSKEFKYTSLHDIEERYEEIGRNYPKNYGWFQCRWHSAAAGIYDEAGKIIGNKLWIALKSKKNTLTDNELISFLEVYAHKSLSNMIVHWNDQN